MQTTDLQLLSQADPFGTVLVDEAHSTVLRFPNPLDRQEGEAASNLRRWPSESQRATHARLSGSNLEKGKRKEREQSTRSKSAARETQATSPPGLLADDK